MLWLISTLCQVTRIGLVVFAIPCPAACHVLAPVSHIISGVHYSHVSMLSWDSKNFHETILSKTKKNAFLFLCHLCWTHVFCSGPVRCDNAVQDLSAMGSYSVCQAVMLAADTPAGDEDLEEDDVAEEDDEEDYEDEKPAAKKAKGAAKPAAKGAAGKAAGGKKGGQAAKGHHPYLSAHLSVHLNHIQLL